MMDIPESMTVAPPLQQGGPARLIPVPGSGRPMNAEERAFAQRQADAYFNGQPVSASPNRPPDQQPHGAFPEAVPASVFEQMHKTYIDPIIAALNTGDTGNLQRAALRMINGVIYARDNLKPGASLVPYKGMPSHHEFACDVQAVRRDPMVWQRLQQVIAVINAHPNRIPLMSSIKLTATQTPLINMWSNAMAVWQEIR